MVINMSEIKIHVFHTGEVCVAPELPFGGEFCNPVKASGIFGKKKDRLWLPVSCYLIEHPQGKILVDTGWKQESSYFQQYYPYSKEIMSVLYQTYFSAMLHYGPNEDDRAGEQFYHYTMRSICQWWSLGKEDCMKELIWLTGDIPFEKQIDKVNQIVSDGINNLEQLYTHSKEVTETADILFPLESQLIKDSIALQSMIHYKSTCTLLKLCSAFSCCKEKEYEKAFFLVGNADEILETILQNMKKAEHGKWKSFYENDCLTDVKFTVYSLESVMRYIRSLGDGPYYYQWALKYCYGKTDYKVVLITNMRNHPRDWELYLKMKNRLSEE